MNISYSTWKTYTECPKKFYLQYIKREPPTVPINDYFALYGRLIEKFFELFSNIWRYETPYMPPEMIREKVAVLYRGILRSSTVNWSAPFCEQTKEEIFENTCTDIGTIMESQNQNYFLNSRSEINIEVKLKNSHTIRGRLDFIHKNPLAEKEEIIFDGKGTNKMKKNISEDQLFFYSLLYYFQFKKIPVGLGFFYYRFNTFVPVPINKDILNKFRAKLSLDIKAIITTTEYKATPSAKACKYCKYCIGCLECLQDKAKRAKPSKIKMEADGIIEFGP